MTALPNNIELLFAFCPTGEGGGVDNSCSSREGGNNSTVATTKVPKALEELLKAAKTIKLQRVNAEDFKDEVEDGVSEYNTWIIGQTKYGQQAIYRFKTPSNRQFTIKVRDNVLDFFDDSLRTTVTGQGEAHVIFGEVSKAALALATTTKIPAISFEAAPESSGRQKLYTRLASSLAAAVQGATATVKNNGEFGTYYKVQLREKPPKGVEFSHESLFTFVH